MGAGSYHIPGLAVRGGGRLAWAQDAWGAWDFLTNEARYAGSYKGALANTPNWTFTRASTGYARNQAGVLIPFASGELRRTDKGALIEGSRTNLILQSQTFDNASWTKSRATVTANAAVAPDGTTTADKLVEDSTSSATHRVFQSVDKAASAITYTGTIYAKAAERNFISFKLSDNTESDQVRVAVNLTTGELSAIGGSGFTSASATATELANGWWRIAVTATSDTDTKVVLFAQVTDALSSTGSYNGDGASGIYIWGAQLEAGAHASSYIPTTTASATRAADSLSITGVTGLDYPLTLYAEFERAVDTGTDENIFYIDDGDAEERCRIVVSGGSANDPAVFATRSANVDQSAVTLGNTATATVYKAAGRIKTNDIRGALNGSVSAQDTSATLPAASPTVIRFGQQVGGSAHSFGYLRRAAIWSRALSDAELQAVTT